MERALLEYILREFMLGGKPKNSYIKSCRIKKFIFTEVKWVLVWVSYAACK